MEFSVLELAENKGRLRGFSILQRNYENQEIEDCEIRLVLSGN